MDLYSALVFSSQDYLEGLTWRHNGSGIDNRFWINLMVQGHILRHPFASTGKHLK